VPANPESRRSWARTLAFDATVYGIGSVLQYRQMYDQAVDTTNADYTGFNVFSHGRELAGPGYLPFKTPNADTLYSHAWLDLTRGPVIFEIPDMEGRYYTANFIDMYTNATNISARTHGMTGGRYLIALTDWEGEVPEGAKLFRVTTPYMWILLRILTTDPEDAKTVHYFQDRFLIKPMCKAGDHRVKYPDGRVTDVENFFRILDFVLRTN
jgi:hypothetical protein